MKKSTTISRDPNDPTAESRKADHISLAFESQTGLENIDERFYYEPMLSGHPSHEFHWDIPFLGKNLHVPIWVSSMTGGTDKAKTINENLAKACAEFGMGMGLGSCRSLLSADDHLSDFAVRKWIGDQPLFANLGIAQIIQLIEKKQLFKINELVARLEADGLIIHVNPLQEWTQPEGDRYYRSPLEAINIIRDVLSTQLIVKEVGHGFGPSSMESLINIGVDALEFAAGGGTNFSKIELARAPKERRESLDIMTMIGHTAEEMVTFYNSIIQFEKSPIPIIISGGVTDFLNGYYLIEKAKGPAIYGQASAFLKHAMGSYEELREYVLMQVEGLKMAKTFLKIKV